MVVKLILIYFKFLKTKIRVILLLLNFEFIFIKILDLRDTFVGDSVISSISYLNELREMYLESPSPEARPNLQDHQLPFPQEQMGDVIYVRFPQRGAQYPDNQVTMRVCKEMVFHY